MAYELFGEAFEGRSADRTFEELKPPFLRCWSMFVLAEALVEPLRN